MNQRTICKGLAVAVIILFLGLAVQPSVATVHPKEKIDVEPKDYLFKTIIDISNNPDVKELLEQYNHNLFTSDYDYKSVYRELLLKKPRLLYSMIFTRPSITCEYLDKCYNKGIEITNILGEDEVIETIENVEVTDRKLFDNLNNIIINDEELSSRLETLKEMNKDIKLDNPWDFPVICAILILIYFPLVLVADVLAFTWLGILYSGNLLLTIIFGLCLVPVWIFFMVNVLIQELFGCWP